MSQSVALYGHSILIPAKTSEIALAMRAAAEYPYHFVTARSPIKFLFCFFVVFLGFFYRLFRNKFLITLAKPNVGRNQAAHMRSLVSATDRLK